MKKAAKRNKWNAKKTEVDGIVFDSGREAARYGALKLLESGGVIRNLKLQVEYPLKVGDVLVCKYRADFVYDEPFADGWREIVEDCKGKRTAEYIIKAKLFRAIYKKDIRET